MYNIFVGKSSSPAASVISDVEAIELDIVFPPGNSQFPERYEVRGSTASKQFQQYLQDFAIQLKQVYLGSRIKDSLSASSALSPLQKDSLLQAANDQLKEKTNTIFQYTRQALAKSTSPALAMMILGYYQGQAANTKLELKGFENADVSGLILSLAQKFPSHQGINTLKEFVLKSDETDQQLLGQTAPEFSLPDPNGKLISLSSFRGKYVLVDFWASWCSPCRMENPVVVAAYQQYKNRNFTVLGVSLDQPGGKDAWLKAVMQDGLVWTQVSDLKFWNSPVVSFYRINGIPYNVLVDPQGKIIAESLRGDDLGATLDRVLPR